MNASVFVITCYRNSLTSFFFRRKEVIISTIKLDQGEKSHEYETKGTSNELVTVTGGKDQLGSVV